MRTFSLFEKQNISKSQWEQMKRMPIFVTDTEKSWKKDWDIDYSYWEGTYPVTSPQAKKFAPKATRDFFETVKHHPEVIPDIWKVRPKAVVYSSIPTAEREGGWTHDQKVFVRPKIPERKKTKRDVERFVDTLPYKERIEARKQLIERTVFPRDDFPRQARRKKARGIAEHIYHELGHVAQERRLGTDEMERQAKKYKYDDIPFEREARRRADKKLMHFRLDTDRDKVPDWRDCRPFNPHLQDSPDFVPAPADIPSKYSESTQIIHMSPKQYLELALAKSDELDRFDERAYDQESLENLRYRMEQELEIDPVSFTVDVESGAIIGHSGRHRAFTAYQLGIETIPVIIYFKYAGIPVQGMKGVIEKPDAEEMELKSELEGLSYKRRR